MPHLKFEITMRAAGGVPRDDIVNTFYLATETVGPDILGNADSGLLHDAVMLWVSADLPLSDQAQWISGKAYNLGDAIPRAPVAEHPWVTAAAARPAGGPREVACCLSFFAGRNLPRNRGRMYLGPFPTSHMFQRPTQAITDGLMGLADGLTGLGGINVQWVTHSTVNNDFQTVTDYWVDNEWDTVRRRRQKATSRAAVSGKSG